VIKAPDRYDVKIDAYGWSKNQQKIVVIKGMSFVQMRDHAARVGVRPQPRTGDIDKEVAKFKTFLGKIRKGK